MHKIVSAFCALVMLINNSSAQYPFGLTIPNQAVPTQISKQQLVNYLLSNFKQAPLSERIEMLTAAVQQMPSKRNRRVYLADVLKNSALQSLLVAASVCNEATASANVIPEFGPLQGYAALSNAVPVPRRNLVVNPNEPLIANRELLSALLPRELVASLIAGEYAQNRPFRFQVV